MAKRLRSNISWTQEDGILLGDLSRYKGKAVGARMKRLAMAGLMLERLGITMDGSGAISGLAERFMVEPARQPTKVMPPAPPTLGFTDHEHEQAFGDLMANMGL
ncbi:MAG TPA: hypothetical protein VN226_01475 [Anaerolineales bacterium]|nr:hypothetical protein [Anaerolineales bacterium]